MRAPSSSNTSVNYLNNTTAVLLLCSRAVSTRTTATHPSTTAPPMAMLVRDAPKQMREESPLTTTATDLLKTLSSQLEPSTKTEVLSRKNEAGNTALHWASVNGHIEAVKALIDSGVDVWVKNAAGHLPVFEAERAEKDEVVATLLIAGGKEDEEKSRAQEGEATEEEKADVEGVTSQMGESSLEK